MAVSQRSRAYLQAMGIQVWDRRGQPPAELAAGSAGGAPEAEARQPAEPTRGQAVTEPSRTTPTDAVAAAGVADPARMDWPTLESTVAACTDCALHSSRQNTVFGCGNRKADWMIIGEAPGAEEDRQGQPFVGRAGLLLNAMLESVGLNRNAVFIANSLKCRPPGNRDPEAEELAQCQRYLARQIALVEPGLILCVGRVSAQSLLRSDSPVGKLRGRVHTLPDNTIPVVVTYHPAYLLRKPTEKRKAWADLKLALAARRPTAH